MQEAIELRHWHPVLLSRKLGHRPVGIKVCDREIVIFRTMGGKLGALIDRCPHRHMRLSKGRVEQDRLICPYHSYRFDATGCGDCPGTPRRRIQALAFDIQERYGVIWVKKKGSDAVLPNLDFCDYYPLYRLHHRVRAPLQLLLDNMTELEHTATVHSYFGFDLQDLEKVETAVECLEDQITIIYKGPNRKIPYYLSWFTGLRSGDRYIQYAKTHFSPIHTIYDLSWFHPLTEHRREFSLKFAIFYNPINDAESEMFTFIFWSRKLTGRLGSNLLVAPILIKIVDRELKRDINIIESLDGDLSLSNFKLGRFDRPLIETRKRVKTIYNGDSGPKPVGKTA